MVKIDAGWEMVRIELNLLRSVFHRLLVKERGHFLTKDVVDLQGHERRLAERERDYRGRIERIRVIAPELIRWLCSGSGN